MKKFGVFFGVFFVADFRVYLPVGISYCLGDRRDRPCRDPLKRDSGRYTITLITNQTPASFEQTQRVPTGHPGVCLCDVSEATNKGIGVPSGVPL